MMFPFKDTRLSSNVTRIDLIHRLGQEAWQESTGRLAATLEESFNGVQQKCLGRDNSFPEIYI